jgi:GNAT superfamily N-acetyltransferase
MQINICVDQSSVLSDYADIPIAFEIRHFLEVVPIESKSEFLLKERPVKIPFVKDYDAIPGAHPSEWAAQFDVSAWGFLSAQVSGNCVGRAAIATKTPSLAILGPSDDVALLWDIRVAPEFRGNGVGSALFGTAKAWAERQGCRELKVETQNINVAACRFYEKQGCKLVAVNSRVYDGLPDELQLIWSTDLGGR